MKFKQSSLHCSFTDSPGFIVGEKILTLSGISSLEILQGGSACRTILSIPSSMQLLTRVMQVLNFVLGLDLYLLDGLKGGNRGGEWGVGFTLWLGYSLHVTGWSLASLERQSASISSL